jgi:hypothetical protein
MFHVHLLGVGNWLREQWNASGAVLKRARKNVPKKHEKGKSIVPLPSRVSLKT